MPIKEADASKEYQEAKKFLSSQQPRGRRGSLLQSKNIHLADTLSPTVAIPTFSSADMEALRHAKSGKISVHKLINMLHPSQEEAWKPFLGEGRRQIRTGRNFKVPDRENPGDFFIIRIHTNDNTITDRQLNSYAHAVVRIQRTEDNRYLMGGLSHCNVNGVAAWSGCGATDVQINAAHIPTMP